jgi:hypothetical protein
VASAAAPPPAAPVNPCPDGHTNGLYGGVESPGSSVSLYNCPGALLGDPNETDTQTLNGCGKSNVETVLIHQDFHVHTMRLWIGAGKGSQFETGICLEVLSPAGSILKTFRKEWDKHLEEHYFDQHFPVDFTIPAGSTVRLSRDPHATITCGDGTKTCVTQEGAELN